MNAEVHSSGDAPVPVDDRGLAFGDGVFETILVRDGQPLLWESHLARLHAGLQRLGIPAPEPDALTVLPAQAGHGLAILKLMITRGSGGRGYQVPEDVQPRLRWRIMPFAPRSERWQDGIAVRSCAWRLARQPALAGLKHLNRLDNVLARREWTDPAIAEGLLRDGEGVLIEATAMNLAWFDRDARRWLTPRLEQCGVAGTLREVLLEEGQLTEVEAGPAALEQAEAACVFNSVQGVWPLERWLEGVRSDTAVLRCHWRLRDPAVQKPLRDLQAAAHARLGYPRM
ncbi:aminodeoxychorismate lyase apoprotein [Kushneria sinocarnis]|uniref:Aminodeoxychorismate lyase n=1 Tax=Kushneria sinocarnis TaxID=595502 RepID=A0A420WYT9_9GAMM|nr:aminodeoxychorismate lyase [Kushneria sinocarnis]RKR06348.1 aminodeoxychorismate lyase apoprotein [Kushneria sinocarnis]